MADEKNLFVDLEHEVMELWEKEKYYVDEFEDYLEEDECEFNSDMIPVKLAEEAAKDMFKYEVLKIYLQNQPCS